MAKQTFTVGQILTSAQMTSLQATAMGGGAATAKTASYVLVAADAGTTVAMNAAGATTITVNTGLFAAGDTVFIQNLGAGACTVTAGTATVATAGSLILPQNDAGILYFTATGTAIFYDYIQAGAVSPLTTKGDVYTFSTSDARLGVGANNTVLTADSAEATGLKWATPSGGGGMTLISTTTLSGGTTTISVSANSYKDLTCYITGVSATADVEVRLQINGISGGTDYTSVLNAAQNSLNQSLYQQTNNARLNAADGTGSGSDFVSYVLLKDANSTKRKVIIVSTGHLHAASGRVQVMDNVVTVGSTTAVSSIEITAVAASFTGGTVLLYGVS